MRVYLGADIYRSANKLATETDFFKGKLTYYTGDHKITAGYEQTTYDIYNVFHLNLPSTPPGIEDSDVRILNLTYTHVTPRPTTSFPTRMPTGSRSSSSSIFSRVILLGLVV